MNFTDRIRPTDKGITTYLDELENLDFQIPTFQRDVVWEKENVKKLWDSIYKFYPLGDQFIEKRVDLVVEELSKNMVGLNVEVIDTKQKS